MKILVAGKSWVGGIIDHISEGFELNGIDTTLFKTSNLKSFSRILKLHQINYFRNKIGENEILEFNNALINKVKEIKPDMFFTFSGGSLLPSTVELFQKELKIETITVVADNPFDALRDKYFAMSFPYYNHIFVCDSIWIDNISKITSINTKIHKFILGYNPNYFFPISKNDISVSDIDRLACDVSFTGSNYGNNAEGAYRAGIINQLDMFDVKVWGEGDWEKRFQFYENLTQFYQGGRLSWSDLRKLYTLSTVNLNLPSPQIYTSFQPRLFDIAAAKGFQIVDKRPDLYNYFKEDEIVTFNTIPELIDKVKYFIKNPKKRDIYTNTLYNKVVKRFNWQNQVKFILERVL